MSIVETVNMKHLVMTGKEHRLPEAFSYINARVNHFLFLIKKKQETEIIGMICDVVVALKCQSQ